MEEKDIKIDTFSNQWKCEMKLTHLPTGTFVKGVTDKSRFKLREKLMDELEEKL